MPETPDVKITLAGLRAELAPLATAAKQSEDHDVLKVAVMLFTIVGAIDDLPTNRQALDALWDQASLISKNRAG
jgi:hypothetical protein